MTPREIIKLIKTAEIIPKEMVLSLMQEKDLEVRGAIYTLTDKAWYQIQPEITMEEQCNFMLRYLIDCIVQNNLDAIWSHSRFDAALELGAWLKHLIKKPEAENFIIAAARELTTMYRTGDDELKYRIGTSVLERIFEVESLRKYFKEWLFDPDLREDYEKYIVGGNSLNNLLDKILMG